MLLTKDLVQNDLGALPERYKTADVDRLIKRYVKEGADASSLRPYILTYQELHRIYFYVSLEQIRGAEQRMKFIHENLLFCDWWHTDQLIHYVADLSFDTALDYAKKYVISDDPFIRRWGYVLFISRLCHTHAEELLALMHNDGHYYVQMAEAWLIAELAIFEPDVVYAWLKRGTLSYSISGKAIQKISDSFRISDGLKVKFKSLRPLLRAENRYISLRECPALTERAAEWFHQKWGVPTEAYLECMNAYLNRRTEYGWYLCLHEGKIVAGLGVIENDFHERKDLTPNICAVYTEPEYRSHGIAGRLLDMAVDELRKIGISPVYLLTDHTGFYERYGWEFLCMVRGDGEDELSRMYVHK